MRKLGPTISILIEAFEEAGGEYEMVQLMREYLDQREFEVCLDYIVDRVGELNISISKEFYELVCWCAPLVGMKTSTYEHIESQVKEMRSE